jgi:uncharacterized membrane protein YeaQ/YmgE (transglycosylase-associated protein family)
MDRLRSDRRLYRQPDRRQIVGAVVGGFIFAQFGSAGVTGFNVYSMIVAIIGAIVVLVIYHAIVGRRAV